MPKTVCERWKVQLDDVIETGEASNELLAHVETCELCGNAVDDAFNRQVESFENFAANLRKAEVRERYERQ